MTTQPSSANTRLLVKEALDRGWVIYSELREAQAAAQASRNALNLLKGQIASDQYQEEGDAKAAQRVVAHTRAHETAMKAAQQKLDAAIKVFEKAKGAADAVRQTADVKTAADWAIELAAHQQKLNLLAAEAQAENRQAEQRANVLATSLERFRQQTEAQLGVDLGKLLETP